MTAIYIFADANKTGAAQEAISGIKRASKAMTDQEARQILGISEQSTWEAIVKVCDIVLPLNLPLQQLFAYHILYLGQDLKDSFLWILQKYDTLFERNAKNGSFYLQSKVHRAKECLEAAYKKPDVTV